MNAFREIKLLRKLRHENVVNLREVVVGNKPENVYIVMDFVDNDLLGLLRPKGFSLFIPEVKQIMMQLLTAVAHLHDNRIIHRDLKTANVLLTRDGVVKVADFGLAREHSLRPMSPTVCTFWERAPEILLGLEDYSFPIDIWSVGCIFGELLTKNALFRGGEVIEQVMLIYEALGQPTEKTWPGYRDLEIPLKTELEERCARSLGSKNKKYTPKFKKMRRLLTHAGFELLLRFLTIYPVRRISAREALKHEWFAEAPEPVAREEMREFPTRVESPSYPRPFSDFPCG